MSTWKRHWPRAPSARPPSPRSAKSWANRLRTGRARLAAPARITSQDTSYSSLDQRKILDRVAGTACALLTPVDTARRTDAIPTLYRRDTEQDFTVKSGC